MKNEWFQGIPSRFAQTACLAVGAFSAPHRDTHHTGEHGLRIPAALVLVASRSSLCSKITATNRLILAVAAASRNMAMADQLLLDNGSSPRLRLTSLNGGLTVYRDRICGFREMFVFLLLLLVATIVSLMGLVAEVGLIWIAGGKSKGTGTFSIDIGKEITT